MTSNFADVWLKIERAKRHIGDLEGYDFWVLRDPFGEFCVLQNELP